jgi:hypothetical protein
MRPLDIDAHHHILARSQRLADVGLGDALVLAIDAGVLQQLAIDDHLLELGRGIKVVIAPVDLCGAGRAICGCDDKVEG